jgi:imidazoleglycerol phosphate dehydratase HisB
MNHRTAEVKRKTAETEVSVRLDLDGSGRHDVATGLGFLDHMLASAGPARPVRSASCAASGDLHIDDHHTAEDCALAIGQALGEALGERRGIERFGHAYAPLDEALARVVVDLGGRPWPEVQLGLRRERIGMLATENLGHVLRSLAIAGRMALHVTLLAARTITTGPRRRSRRPGWRCGRRCGRRERGDREHEGGDV